MQLIEKGLFTKSSRKACVCGKSDEKVQVNIKRIWQRAWLIWPSVLILLAVMIIGGVQETYARGGWWAFPLLALWIVFFVATTARRLYQGHSIWCALRYAYLRVF